MEFNAVKVLLFCAPTYYKDQEAWSTWNIEISSVARKFRSLLRQVLQEERESSEGRCVILSPSF